MRRTSANVENVEKFKEGNAPAILELKNNPC